MPHTESPKIELVKQPLQRASKNYSSKWDGIFGLASALGRVFKVYLTYRGWCF